ncbi:MAG: hypothetical protein QM765_36525 [Myxococcales bacterium]
MQPDRKEDLANLKRMVRRLALLDGTPLVCLEGLALVRVREVFAPAELLDDLSARGGLSVRALARFARLERDPVVVEARWLAAAQRDLKALEQSPEARQQLFESRRVFRRYATPDAAWLERCQGRIDELSALLHRPPSTPPSLALVHALHGAEAVEQLSRWRARSVAWGRLRRERSQRRVEHLAAQAAGQPAPHCDLPDEIARTFLERLHACARRRGGGRALVRRIREVMAEALAWPEPPPALHDALLDGVPAESVPTGLAQAIRMASEELLAGEPSTRRPEYLQQLDRALALMALTWQPEPEGLLTPRDVRFVLNKLPHVAAHGSRAKLSFSQGLALLRLNLNEHEHGKVERLVLAGLETELVAKVAAVGTVKALGEFEDDADAARTWARWVTDLAPGLKQQGVELDLPARAFRTGARGPKRDLVLFASAMLAYPGAAADGAAAKLARLDAVLGLVQAAPERARAMRARLETFEPGAGRRRFPEFADWLDDDESLDRFCHLCLLAGEEPALPRALMRDYSRVQKLASQRAHLARLPAPSPAQQARLQKVEAQLRSQQMPTPLWTRRHLRERVEWMLGRALQAQLDLALQEALRAGVGIAPPALTASWRDAVRFLFTTNRNGDLLRRLLRHAASQPGVPIVRTLAANQEWLAKARRRFDTEAWLAPRQATLQLDGRGYSLATEDDPLEVLRMGIPFNTCLSLLDGCNAASTVINALDANKRVLYLRDEGGTVVARKLLAVGRGRELIGYNLYFALSPPLRPAVERAVGELCAALARDAGLELVDAGTPEQIHPGFWYDDGPVPFEVSVAHAQAGALEQYCRALGRPRVGGCQSLRDEAVLFQARRDGDVEGVLAALDPWSHRASQESAACWAVEQLGEAEALRRSGHNRALAAALVRASFEESPAKMLATIARLPSVPTQAWEDAAERLAMVEDARGLVPALAAAARRQCGRQPHFDDHGFEHGTLYVLPHLVELAPIAETLESIGQFEPVWAYVQREQPDCADCVRYATGKIASACEFAYARSPDPQAVLRTLERSRSGETALRLALRLAAAFPLPRTAREPSAPGWGLSVFERAPVGCPAAMRALRELRDHKPALAKSPDSVAALLRQSGPGAELLQESDLVEPEAAPFEALADSGDAPAGARGARRRALRGRAFRVCQRLGALPPPPPCHAVEAPAPQAGREDRAPDPRLVDAAGPARAGAGPPGRRQGAAVLDAVRPCRRGGTHRQGREAAAPARAGRPCARAPAIGAGPCAGAARAAPGRRCAERARPRGAGDGARASGRADAARGAVA